MGHMTFVRPLLAFVLIGLALNAPTRVAAIELSHYAPGLPNVDDVFLPPPEAGELVYAQYFLWYSTDTYKNATGRKVDSVSFRGPLGNERRIDFDFDIDQFVIAPAFMWAPKNFSVLGARYGAYTVIPIGNPSSSAAIDTQIGFGRDLDDSAWGLGDVFFQPLWLMWSKPTWDLTFGYGFYAPTGRYSTGSSTNVGFGFWAHQVQDAFRYHFDAARTLSAVLTSTIEFNQNKEGADIVPGGQFTLQWALRKNLENGWLQFAVLGYDSWQMYDDGGSDATDDARDAVHAAGLQVGIPKYGLAVKYLHEFLAEDRFEGQVVSLFFALPLDPIIDKIASAFH
jgi:hypothetical protein